MEANIEGERACLARRTTCRCRLGRPAFVQLSLSLLLTLDFGSQEAPVQDLRTSSAPIPALCLSLSLSRSRIRTHPNTHPDTHAHTQPLSSLSGVAVLEHSSNLPVSTNSRARSCRRRGAQGAFSAFTLGIGTLSKVSSLPIGLATGPGPPAIEQTLPHVWPAHNRKRPSGRLAAKSWGRLIDCFSTCFIKLVSADTIDRVFSSCEITDRPGLQILSLPSPIQHDPFDQPAS